MPPRLSGEVDAWIASQPEPHPSRPEAIRRLVEKGLSVPPPVTMQPDAALDHLIAQKEAVIADMPEQTERSPEAALAKMDKALAENTLVKMKNERTRRKIAKRK